MRFQDVEHSCDELRRTLAGDTGIELFGSVSVERPGTLEDELHFVRLVSWTYVFLIEVASAPVKHLQSLLRGSSPSDHAKVADLQRLVRNLRTFQAHQLSDGSNSDQVTKTFVTNWLSINSGPDPWPQRSELLCSMFVEAMAKMSARWATLVADAERREGAIAALVDAVDRQWPAHVFDRMLEDAATDLGISGLDFPLYRGMRIDEWKKLTECFQTREDAELALRRAIRTDLGATFGASLPQ